MRSFLTRVVNYRPLRLSSNRRRSTGRQIRTMAVLVIVCLLLASLPSSAGTTRGSSISRNIRSSGQLSLAFQLYHDVSNRLVSIGSWMASYVRSESANGRIDTYQPVVAYFNSAPPFIDAPTNLNVTGVQANRISLSWIAPPGAVDHYTIERSTNVTASFQFLTNVSGAATLYNDDSVSNLHSYLYRVRAVTSTGVTSVPSNMAMGTAIAFQFANLQGQEIRKQHFYDARTAVNAVRAVANLPAASWAPRDDLTGLEVKVEDIQLMRTALDAALQALSIPITTYEDSTLTSNTLIRAVHLEQLQTRSTRGSSNTSGAFDSDSSTARLDPMNETGGGGENPLSRNFNWNLPILNLPGRAGMDLGLTLSYNSLVWTTVGNNAIAFDEDNGFPGPGFRLGFPVIQPLYANAQTGKDAFILINPDGSRTELRQVGSLPLYESADSSHLLLDATTMILRTTSGTQLSYELQGAEYKCTQIKDRNGNYITASYDLGRLNTITDTLGRVIDFNYSNGSLTSITQQWLASPNPPHKWAQFEYADKLIHVNFPTKTTYGAQENNNVKTLTKVTLADDSYFVFDYTSWGQMYEIRSYAPDTTLLNSRRYNLPLNANQAHEDCPRFTERYDWAKYWNGDTNGALVSGEEALTLFAVPADDTWTMPGETSSVNGKRAQVTAPDGTSNKIYFLSTQGWQRGLPALVDTYSSGGSVPVRRSKTTWTQDNTSVSYPLNPRVVETNVYDDANNRARTVISYQHFDFPNGTNCELPEVVKEYAADASTILRSTKTVYNMDEDYTSRRILGLVSDRFLYEGAVGVGPLMAKLTFVYDGSGSILGNDEPVRHDNDDYDSSFVFRGNLSSVKRYDVTNLAVFTTTSTKYNTAGSVVSATDAANHTVAVGYTDSFSDGVTRTTLAYPTRVTDPDNFYSTSQYNFNFGAITRQKSPRPNSTDSNDTNPRPEQSWTYDSIGRLQQITNLVNDAYTRFAYPTSGIRVDAYATIKDTSTETHSFKFTDGAGRVIATAVDHNASTFSGQRIVYDVMGRVIKTSNPTETTASGSPLDWNTTGDDQDTGWIYTEQTYDWKGRRLVTTYPSITGTASETTTKQFSYSGCGCAGGQVITVTDQGTIQAENTLKQRQQKIYADVLGRTVKTEILNWDGTGPNGTGGTVYSARTFTYNARDQVELVRQFAGSTSSTTFQDTTSTYDGFGRLKTQHLPEQQADTSYSASTDHTTWNYNNDDSVASVVDARGVVTSFTYNARRLTTLIEFDSSDVPASKNVPSTANMTFTYDARGNRTSMSDGSGSVSYHYDQSGLMDWEERTFAALQSLGAFRLSYEYNLGGILKKVTDVHSETSFTETLDKLGRVTEVNAVGSGSTQTQFMANAQYRAWGALESRTEANATLSLTYNSRLLPKTYTLTGNFPAEMDYVYNNDGSIKFANDQTGTFDIKDRAYAYDAAGRLQHAYTGQEARNFVDNTNLGTPDGPYDHQYLYDHWGNLLQNSGRLWTRTTNTSAIYDVNNRVSAWSYDAEGNVLSRNEVATTESPFVPAKYTFDAAGRQVGSTQTRSYILENGKETSEFVNSQTLDGDGQMTYYALVRNLTYANPQLPPATVTTAEAYLLCSTVLGGGVISEYKGDGTWSKTHVYSGDERLGHQTTTPVGDPLSLLETSDPITGDGVHLSSAGGVYSTTVFDPNGADLGFSDPFPPDGSGAEGGGLGELTKTVPYITPIEGGGAKCVLDGLEIECSRISGDASVQCPNNDCGTNRVTVTARSNGKVIATSEVFGPAGWYGSQDGTYSVESEWMFANFASLDGIDGNAFVTTLMLNPRGVRTGEFAAFRRKSEGDHATRFLSRHHEGPPMDFTEAERLLTPSCKQFLNSILEQLNKGKTAYSTDFAKNFQAARDQNAFHVVRLPDEVRRHERVGGTWHVIGDPSFRIEVDITNFNGPDFSAGYVIIHETFHGSSVDRWGYSHFEMAQAAYNVALANPSIFNRLQNYGHKGPPRRGTSKTDETWNAGVFDSIVKIGCPTPPKE